MISYLLLGNILSTHPSARIERILIAVIQVKHEENIVGRDSTKEWDPLDPVPALAADIKYSPTHCLQSCLVDARCLRYCVKNILIRRNIVFCSYPMNIIHETIQY